MEALCGGAGFKLKLTLAVPCATKPAVASTDLPHEIQAHASGTTCDFVLTGGVYFSNVPPQHTDLTFL